MATIRTHMVAQGEITAAGCRKISPTIDRIRG
jgi:hypothetical protein